MSVARIRQILRSIVYVPIIAVLLLTGFAPAVHAYTYLSPPANTQGQMINDEPHITWDPVGGADHYNIYRFDNIHNGGSPPLIGTSSTNSFVDQTGTELARVWYAVAAVDASGNVGIIGGSADIAYSTVGQISFSKNLLPEGQTTTISVPVLGDYHNLQNVIYTLYTQQWSTVDQQGQLTYDNASNTWQATFGSDLPADIYDIQISAVDPYGDTTVGNSTFVVYNPDNHNYITGHYDTLPIESNILPIPLDTSSNPAKLTVSFNNDKSPASGSFDVDYVVQKDQNEFNVRTTSTDWVEISDDNTQASIRGRADLTTYIDGVKTVTHNVVMQVNLKLGTNGDPDRMVLGGFTSYDDWFNGKNLPLLFLTKNSDVAGSTVHITDGPLVSAVQSPTNQAPALTWNSVDNVDHYDVYRDGSVVGSSLATSFTDNSATNGSHTYTVKSVVNNVESDPSNAVTVVYDTSAPILGTTTWTANPLQSGQNSTLSIPASDSLSGVQGVRYSINGGTSVAMTYDSTSNSWKAMFGNTLGASTYNIVVTATDFAGNTSTFTDVLAVYTPSNGYVTGHAKTLPTASDTLPIARDASNNPAKLVIGFTNVTAPTSGSFDVSYVVKKNKNEFSLSSTGINWVIVQDSTHASILGHGDLTTYVNGVKTVTQNVSVRFDVVLGTNGAADHVTMKIYNPGVDPNVGLPVSTISDDVIANGSNLMIHP